MIKKEKSSLRVSRWEQIEGEIDDFPRSVAA